MVLMTFEVPGFPLPEEDMSNFLYFATKYAKFIECFRQGRVGSVAVITAVNVCTQQALVSFHLHFSGRKSFHHTFELFAQRIN